MVFSSKRVFKKSSPDGKVTVYLEKREFVDKGGYTEPVEGVVTLDHSALEPNERLFVALVGKFRYGREEDEILGMSLCREIFLGHLQLCPNFASPRLTTSEEPSTSSSSTTSKMYSIQLGPVHERLMSKLGDDAIPFRFELPLDAPVSTVMQRLSPDSGDTCGVRYFIRCYAAIEPEDKPPVKSSVNLAIRKVQYAKEKEEPICPKGSVCKDFPLNGGKLFLEATLDKELYYHGEDIIVDVVLQNFSHKTIKHIKASILQVADIRMFSTGRWKVTVATADNREDSPIHPGTVFHKQFILRPSIENNRHKYGVFIQDDLDILASSTIISDEAKKNLFGIVVSYEVKVKLCLGTLSSLSGRGEIACIVPFQLMNSNPDESPTELLCLDDELPQRGLVNGVEKRVGFASGTMSREDSAEPEVIQKLSELQVHGVPLID